ncbi:large subunit ribosomal protein L24 [Ruminiclostridium sufflavum DSM 19573]|uniref:Large ribosomal subunit protein uL24 n=1 Tax=Ruminiclostridium sufflavum DSM 19573 TaxID=1121337 RepID=A0A318XTI3_9FIRM|nr:50S ribosomal protein L24 [Ruminiclostridium sufflavum]PYG85662.1 large subunit ribosomal protein L24 [Ruminiclostridium sufflavum DSM 19573]
MANKVHIKKEDTVLVLSGKDKGKKGKVLSVNPSTNQVIVEGVNMATKHKKPRSNYQQGGIIHQEAPVDSSNLMLVCDKCGKPTKVAKTILENGEKARTCKKCDEIIEIVINKKDV